MTQPVNILVVDDFAPQRLAIEAALSELGERVVPVASGLEALKFLLDHDAAVVLLDVNMPDMDGFETARLIRQRPRNSETPVIFLTADPDELRAAEGYALGAVDYLFCPFAPEILRTKVRVFVALSRARERAQREAQQVLLLQIEQAARATAEEQGQRLSVLLETSNLMTRTQDGLPFQRDLLAQIVPHLADEAGLVAREGARGSTSIAWLSRRGDEVVESDTVPQDLDGPLQAVLASGRDRLIAHPDGQGVHAAILPLTNDREVMGALVAVARPDTGVHREPDLDVLRLVARRVADGLVQRKLYRELQDRDRRKDEFLAMLSHELRNPLGAIASAVGVLDLVSGADDRAARAQQVIARQTRHLGRLVDDLLDVSRVTIGRITLNREAVDLQDIVSAAVHSLRETGQLEQRECELRTERVVVEADAARMEQVTSNLLVNAVKYTEPGGRISVTVGLEEGAGVLRVVDNGAGISPDLLPLLFDLFVQGRHTLDRANGGLGIGLTLVKRLVELHGGSVEATSPGVGRGSTFTVRMPLMAAEPRHVTDGPHARLPLPSLRVLIVEDSLDAQEMLSRYFEMGGHRVHSVSSGPEAVEAAQRIRPDVALVDLGLPGFDGFEVARRLREDQRTRDIVLVALTGYGQSSDRDRTARLGFDAHLVKPAAPERLTEVVALALGRQSAWELGGA
jgi:signal transduction histidine kinase/DNA-binding response OmpR family regulator